MPFFMPAGILDNMPNFQRGIMAALGRFSTELMDQLGRTRGSSQTDRDLEQARGFLNEQPNIWIWQPSVSLLAVGDLGAEIPRRPRQAGGLQQAAGVGAGGVRAPRRQPAGPARPHRQRRGLGFGGDRSAHHREGRRPVRSSGPTTSSISTRAGSTPTTCCCASSASTSRTSSANGTSTQRLERHGRDLPHRRGTRSVDRVERLSRRVADPQPSRRAGLLPAAGAHAAARDSAPSC